MTTEWIKETNAYIEREIERVKSYGGTVIYDVSDYLDRQAERERSRSRSVWDKISDYASDIYDIAKGAASDVFTEVQDWLSERFNSMSWANALLMGDVWWEIDKAVSEVTTSGHEAWDVNDAYIDMYREQATEPAKESKGLIFEWVDERLEGVADAFAVAFQHLAPVFAALLEIPAMVFFELLARIVTPPGAEES